MNNESVITIATSIDLSVLRIIKKSKLTMYAMIVVLQTFCIIFLNNLMYYICFNQKKLKSKKISKTIKIYLLYNFFNLWPAYFYNNYMTFYWEISIIFYL